MNKWCDENFFALIRRSSNKGTYDDDGDKPGRIHFICTHGYKRKSRATHHRPIQRVNFTVCPCHVTITQKDRGQWVVTAVEMSHEGHLVSEDVYNSYQHVKKLSKDDEEYVKQMMNVHAAPRNIATCLSQRTGHNYKPKDVQNIINNIKHHIKDTAVLEEHLAEIKSEGGTAQWSINEPRWRWIQPNPEVVQHSAKAFPTGNNYTMYLYHEYQSHYDLLVFRDFAPPTEKVSGVRFEEEEFHRQESLDSSYSLPSPPKVTAPQEEAPISPLQFLPHVRSKGRPTKKRCGMPQFNKKSSEHTVQSRKARGRKRKDVDDANVDNNDTPSESTPVGGGHKRMFVDPDHTPLVNSPPRKEVTKRGRGRPPGSKNKKKKGQVNNKETNCEICTTTWHVCSKCRSPTCNFCLSNPEEAEDNSKRCCKQCA